MKKGKALSFSKKYHIDRTDERLGQFLLLANRFNIKSALYPGSFVHITPSFVFPKVVYVDSNRQARDFFKDPSVHEFISNKKLYSEDSIISFHHKDYRKNIGEPPESFDLLISQYAGFIADVCKPYLREGGYLLVNNSHGDAGMASLDSDYQLIAAVHRRKGKYLLSTVTLDDYFIPKKDLRVTREMLLERGKGVGYTKTAPLYLFQKVT